VVVLHSELAKRSAIVAVLLLVKVPG